MPRIQVGHRKGLWARSTVPATLTAPGIHFGDSLTSFGYQADPARWGLPLMLNQTRMFYNLGIANETLTDMLARQSDAIDDAAAVGSTWVLMRAGTNGVGTGDFETKYAQLVDAFVAAGLFVFCCQVPPKTGSDFSSLNTIISVICATRQATTKYVADADVIAESGYQPISGTTLDGIHMSPVGAYLMGVAQAAILAPYFSSDPRVKTSGAAEAQWVTNPLMSGTGGTKSGVSGTVPDSWAVTAIGAGITCVCSVQAADGGDAVQVPYLRLAIAAMGAGSSIEVRGDMVHSSIAADFSAVRALDCIGEIRLTSFDTTNMTGIQIGPDSARTYIQPSSNPPRVQMLGNGVLSHTLVMRNCYERSGPSAYSANGLKWMLNIVATNGFSGATGTLDLRCASAVGVIS